jgi:4-methyl-5(b-hydroxyethyl)-thiazole monophosphate biosynthesis
MKKRVLCLMMDGFEEAEMVTPVDMLRRAECEVVIAAVGEPTATGKCGIKVVADTCLSKVDPSGFDLLLIPGGPAVMALLSDGRAAGLAKDFASTGKPVAAICAAPLILKEAGLLEGREFTAWYGVRDQLGAGCIEARVVSDSGIITSRGAGTALDFGLELVATLCGREVADKVAREVMA